MRPYKFHLALSPEDEEYVRLGLKTIDARVQSGQTEGLSRGDVIRFNSARVRVLSIRRYPSFADLLAREDYKKLFPAAANREEAEERLGSSRQLDEPYLGVEAIEFMLLEG